MTLSPPIAVNSLQWDSFEQFCLWQLLSAEGPDCHLVIPALASLSTEGEREGGREGGREGEQRALTIMLLTQSVRLLGLRRCFES